VPPAGDSKVTDEGLRAAERGLPVAGVAGGALLLAGVVVVGCWSGCCRAKQAARHAMPHHLHPLPQAAGVHQAFGYPASAPAVHATAYPRGQMTLEDFD
jgi:hypothetical protein